MRYRGRREPADEGAWRGREDEVEKVLEEQTKEEEEQRRIMDD